MMTERENKSRDDQGSAGRSSTVGEGALGDERDTPDDKGRAIEHGAEQYYRNNAPDDGPLDPGEQPEAPGKVPRGRSAT
jgi:hypothetical protein